MPNPGNDNQQKNVIILWNYLNWGGAQIYFLSIVKHAPENWKFKIVVPKNSPTDIVELFKKNGAEVDFQDTFLDTSPAYTIAQKLKRQWRRIHSEITTYKYISRQNLKDTVLHIETNPWQSWIFIKKLTGKINIFITMHNSLPAVSSWREKIWKRRMNFVANLKGFHYFTSNQDTKNSLIGWFPDKFWEKIQVTYTCVDPSEIQQVLDLKIPKSEIRKQFSVDENSFVVLGVGQFIDRKGRREFLESAKILVENGNDINFLWLTQSELDKEDLDLIESYKLGNRFRLIKSKEAGTGRIDVLKFFQIADVFALPSFVEGLPIALLEAMALGIPSISTDVNAIPEAIIDRRTGLLTEPGNGRALADSILELKNDQELRGKISASGREFVIEKFDERVCAKIVLESYNSALNENH